MEHSEGRLTHADNGEDQIPAAVRDVINLAAQINQGSTFHATPPLIESLFQLLLNELHRLRESVLVRFAPAPLSLVLGSK